MEYYTTENTDMIIRLIKEYCCNKENDTPTTANGILVDNYDDYYLLDLMIETLASERDKEIKKVYMYITQPLFPTRDRIDTLHVEIYNKKDDTLLDTIDIRKTINYDTNERKTEILNQ